MRLRALVVACGVAFSLAPGGPVTAPQACAATPDHAALVVDSGSQAADYCVAIPSGGVTGLGLIERAGDQYGLDYLLGDSGQAVCGLGGVGSSDPNDCFSEYPYFWGYWHGSSSGAWTWASTGGGSYTVHPGDIEGWSWSTGQDGSSHSPPPPTTYAKVCDSGPSPQPTPTHSTPPKPAHERHAHHADAKGVRPRASKQHHESSGSAGAPPASPLPGGSSPPPSAASPGRQRVRSTRSPQPGPSARPQARRSPRRNDKNEKRRARRPTPGPSGSTAAFGSSSPRAPGGPPAAGIAAVAAAMALGGAGALFARRRGASQ